jgi:predicted transport protein
MAMKHNPVDTKKNPNLALVAEVMNAILLMGAVRFEPRKRYLAFLHKKKEFVGIVIDQSELYLYLNLRKGRLKDPKGLTEDVSNMGHWGHGDYAVTLRSTKELPYALKLIKQAHAYN